MCVSTIFSQVGYTHNVSQCLGLDLGTSPGEFQRFKRLGAMCFFHRETESAFS